MPDTAENIAGSRGRTTVVVWSANDPLGTCSTVEDIGSTMLGGVTAIADLSGPWEPAVGRGGVLVPVRGSKPPIPNWDKVCPPSVADSLLEVG